jgi:Domain of unknown function (DUF1707)
MVERGEQRASDADRERTAAWLRRAIDEGRLLADEYDERLGQALSAHTYGELDAIVADLPRERELVKHRGRLGTVLFRSRSRALVAGALAAVAVAAPLTATNVWTSGSASSRCWWYTNPASAVGKTPAQLRGMCAGDRPSYGHARVDR